jgi:hypothetical protein
MPIAMTCRAAFASRFLGFLLRPSMRRPFFVSSLAALAGDLALPARIHYSEAASTFDHDASLDWQLDGAFTLETAFCCRQSPAVQLVCPRITVELSRSRSSRRFLLARRPHVSPTRAPQLCGGAAETHGGPLDTMPIGVPLALDDVLVSFDGGNPTIGCGRVNLERANVRSLNQRLLEDW